MPETRNADGSIRIDRVAPAVAAARQWYGFRWNGKGNAPAYLTFPDADELTFACGDPAPVHPAPDRGTLLDVVHSAYLDGVKLDGVAWLAPGAKRIELFRVRNDALVWTKEITATEAERVCLLDSLGLYTEEERKALIDAGLLSAESPATSRLLTELDPYRATDLANAELFIALSGRDIRYIPPWSKWFLWTGSHWKLDETMEVHRLATGVTRALYRRAADTEEEGTRRKIAALAKSLENERRRAAMIVSAMPSVVIHYSELNRGNFLLNASNGTVDLRTGQLRPHNRDDLLTHDTAIPYLPEATAPTWLRFLNDIFKGDAGLIQFVQRAFGYSLTGSVKEQVLFVCYGVGSNGKGKLFNLLRKLLGTLAAPAPASLLMASKTDRHPTELAALFGKRAVIAQETERGQRFNESLVKSLTGGDAISARRMREDFWEFEPTHKLWLATNHKPIIKGTDYAIWRRIRLIPFNVVFTDESDPRKDPDIEDKLTAELPGILAWAVRGCLDWQRDGLGMADAVKAATASYQAEMDVLAAWLEECCVIKYTAEAKAGDLYASYTAWCEANGERPELQRSFGSRLTERGFERKRRLAGHHWLGIGLLTSASHVGNDPYDPKVDIDSSRTSSRDSIRKTGSYGSYGTCDSSAEPPEPGGGGGVSSPTRQTDAPASPASTPATCSACCSYQSTGDGLGACSMHGKIVHPNSRPVDLACGEFEPKEERS